MKGFGMLVWIHVRLLQKIVMRKRCSRPSEPASPKRDSQKHAKSTFELSLRRKALVWVRWHLVQAREARLSDNAWRTWHVAAVFSPGEGWPRSGEKGSPKRELTW